MWFEIRNRAKVELFHVFILSDLCMVENDSVSSLDTFSPDTFFKEDPPSEAILKRWKFIVNMFQENGFI